MLSRSGYYLVKK
ncbi:hypothetical protein BLA29_015503 [Euroglyphus maynei]|uniref:Uncharacterized protein n=1 Tax=Euroglyphus maynei TaxID=6958 RepID=A0A1Y3B7Y1_EURMA|nr:hypothetical protein BLA29_015503 [Euroglyphus maynei]